MMAAFALFILKIWLASMAAVLVWCAWRLWEFRFVAIPSAAVLILCAGVRAFA